MKPGPSPVPMWKRFWPKVSQVGNVCECWTWLGAKDIHGYGRFNKRSKTALAHRISYELIRGKIPDGLDLDHLCREPSCVNPWHLEAVAHIENMRRSPVVGSARGEQMRSRTHCPYGHPYDETNTRVNRARVSKTARSCKECGRRRFREWYKRNGGKR